MEQSAVSPDDGVLVLGVRAWRGPSRRLLLLAAAAALGASAIAVAVIGAPTAPSRGAVEHLRSASAVLQRLTVGATVKRAHPHRDRFSTVSDGLAAAADIALPALGPATPVGDAQHYAADAVRGHGWSSDQFGCLVALWSRESGWNTHAGNADGAYGIPQALPGSKMGAAGGDWRNSAEVQINWGLAYIAGHYGSPCAALAHSNAVGYY